MYLPSDFVIFCFRHQHWSDIEAVHKILAPFDHGPVDSKTTRVTTYSHAQVKSFCARSSVHSY